MEDSTYVVIVSGDSDRSPKHFRTLRDARADADAHALYGNEAIVYKVGFTDPKAAIDAVHKGAGEEVYTGLLPNPRAAREDVDEPMAPPFQFPVQFIKDIAQQRPLRASLRLMRASDGPKIIKNALLKAFESYPSTVMGAAMIFGIVAITYIIDVINSIEWIGVLIRSPVASLLGVTVVLFAIALVPAVWVEVYQRLLGWPLYGRGISQ